MTNNLVSDSEVFFGLSVLAWFIQVSHKRFLQGLLCVALMSKQWTHSWEITGSIPQTIKFALSQRRALTNMVLGRAAGTKNHGVSQTKVFSIMKMTFAHAVPVLLGGRAKNGPQLSWLCFLISHVDLERRHCFFYCPCKKNGDTKFKHYCLLGWRLMSMEVF